MAVDKLNTFTNREYTYTTKDDVFLARGKQLNMINDTLNLLIDEVDAGGSGSSVWTKTGTNLSPTTAGDDIHLAVGSEFIRFGDTGTVYIGSPSTGSISMYSGGTGELVRFGASNITVYRDIHPSVASTYDLGSDSAFFQYGYINQVNFVNTSTRITRDGSNNLSFTDAVSGTVTLASLVAGGGGDVTKVGTPVNNQVGVWTGDGTLEGTSAVTFDGSNFSVTGGVIASDGVDNAQLTGTYLSFSENGINYIQAHNPGGYVAIRTNGRPASEANSNMVFHADQSNSMPGLGDNDSEDHVVAINNTTGLLTKRSVASIAGGGMVYPGAGIALSTGSAWGTSITNNSGNWNTAFGWGDHASGGYLAATHTSTYNHTQFQTAYTHSQIITGNPHVIGYADISDFATGVSNNETSHTGVVVDGDFSANGILRRTGAGAYASLTGSSGVDTVEDSLTEDATHIPTSNAVFDAIAAVSGVSVTNWGTNRVITASGVTDVLNAEANMTFTGTVLAVTGAITATGEITAYLSDRRLKKKIENIKNPIEKIMQINGVTHEWIDGIKSLGFTPTREVETSTIAQEIGAVIPDGVCPAPFDVGEDGKSISGKDYLTVRPEKIVPLLIEAIKAQQKMIEELQNK